MCVIIKFHLFGFRGCLCVCGMVFWRGCSTTMGSVQLYSIHGRQALRHFCGACCIIVAQQIIFADEIMQGTHYGVMICGVACRMPKSTRHLTATAKNAPLSALPPNPFLFEL